MVGGLSAGVRKISFGWKKLEQFSPSIATALAGILIYYLIKTPATRFFEEIIVKKCLPNSIQWLFIHDLKHHIPSCNEFVKNEVVSFADKNQFAPGSIDPYINNLIKNIRLKKILPAKQTENIVIPKLILATGESQIGKTHSLQALAHELGAGKYILVEAAHLKNMFVGGTEELIENLFKYAKNNSSKEQPFVIILDEIDGLVRAPESSPKGNPKNNSADHKTDFAQAMHGYLQNISENRDGFENVYLLATTNFYDKIQQTIQRRFMANNGIYTHQPPNIHARKAIILQYAKKKNIELNEKTINFIISKTDGKCIPEIKNMVDKVAAAKCKNDIANVLGQNNYTNLSLDKDITEFTKKEKSIFTKTIRLLGKTKDFFSDPVKHSKEKFEEFGRIVSEKVSDIFVKKNKGKTAVQIDDNLASEAFGREFNSYNGSDLPEEENYTSNL